jgi:hypothetical protein
LVQKFNVIGPLPALPLLPPEAGGEHAVISARAATAAAAALVLPESGVIVSPEVKGDRLNVNGYTLLP